MNEALRTKGCFSNGSVCQSGRVLNNFPLLYPKILSLNVRKRIGGLFQPHLPQKSPKFVIGYVCMFQIHCTYILIKIWVWKHLKSFPLCRSLVGVAVLEGPMYAVGGHDGWSYLNTVERWDPQARQWNFVATMSTPRSTVGVAVLSGK